MANPTTNFGWQMPTAVNLVTDLPADFEVFGQAVDTDFVDLLGGTTGQVLAKASDTDLDFVWSADAGMTNPMTTTGDVIYSSPGSTPVRLGIGSTADVLTVAGGVPTWAAPGASYTLISTTNLNTTPFTLTSIPQTYLDLVLVVENFLPSSDNDTLAMRINNDSGANRYASDFGVTQATGSFNRTGMYLFSGNDNAVGTGLSVADVYDYTNATTWKIQYRTTIANHYPTPTNYSFISEPSFYNQTDAVTSLGIYTLSGNATTSGTLKLYGRK